MCLHSKKVPQPSASHGNMAIIDLPHFTFAKVSLYYAVYSVQEVKRTCPINKFMLTM